MASGTNTTQHGSAQIWLAIGIALGIALAIMVPALIRFVRSSPENADVASALAAIVIAAVALATLIVSALR